VQGLGFALHEHLLDEEGRIITANLGEYKLPSAADIPTHRTVFVHDRKGPGPFQSKPIGENGIVPTTPAVANAVYDAIGVQITDLPITAEKIYLAIRGKKNF
jgi:CO/xanthine dehydrogenase Mo-binding subunit